MGITGDAARLTTVANHAVAGDITIVKKLAALEKPPGEWNRYEVRCEGRRIVLKINGVQTVDYTEADATIPQWGRIGLQVHGGGVTEASYRAITIEELP